MSLSCPKCGSQKMTTGFKALSKRLFDWKHTCLDCGEIVWIGLQFQIHPNDHERAERLLTLKNRILALSLT